MTKLISVPLSELHESPENPRRDFGSIPELAATIEAQGLIEPIVARPREGGGYWIVAGARRSRALKHLGAKKTDVVVRDYSATEALAVMLAENTERESLNALEIARGYQGLVELGLSKEQVADRMGIGKSTVYASLSLLTLPAQVQQAITTGKLTGEAARHLTTVTGERLQLAAFEDALKLVRPGEKSPASRAVQKMVQDKYLSVAKKGQSKRQKEAKEHGVDIALRRRVLPLLLDAVAERLERKAQMPEEDMRLMAIAAAETGPDVIREVFQRRGLRPDRLSKVGATQLRSLTAVLAYAPAVALVEGEYPPFAKTLAKVHNLSLSELEKSAAAVEEAEKLFKKE